MNASQVAAANNTGQPQIVITPDQFVANTKAKNLLVAAYTPYIDGGAVNINFPPTGLGVTAWLHFEFTVVVSGTIGGGTWAGWPTPAPLSFIKRLRFGNNNSVYIRDLSGTALYTWLRNRQGMDPNQENSNVLYSSLTNADMGNGQTWPTPGAAVTAGTYKFFLSVPLPLAYNAMGDKGLLVMQSNNMYYTLSLDFGSISGGISATGGSNDAFTGLTGTGIGVAVTANVTTTYDYFDIIPGLPINNLLSQYMAVTDNLISPQNAGQNTYQIPNGDVYTTLIFQHSNNGALITPKNIQSPQISHNGAIVDAVDPDALMRGIRNWYMHSSPPMDGTVIYDWGLRRGIPGRRDMMDAVASSAITNFQYQYTYPASFTSTNSSLRVITESLRQATQNLPY